jgi:hypothetical protein
MDPSSHHLACISKHRRIVEPDVRHVLVHRNLCLVYQLSPKSSVARRSLLVDQTYYIGIIVSDEKAHVRSVASKSLQKVRGLRLVCEVLQDEHWVGSSNDSAQELADRYRGDLNDYSQP